MEIHFKIIGIILFLLGIAHVAFPSYFKWKTDLAKLSLINKQMMIVHTFFLVLVIMAMGYFCVFETKELIFNPFGKKITLAFAYFWLIRLVVQFIGYSPKLWKGKSFETFIHIVFSLLWTYFSFTFFYSYYH